MKITRNFINKHKKEILIKVENMKNILYLINFFDSTQYSFSKFKNIIFNKKYNEYVCNFEWYTFDENEKKIITNLYIPIKYLYDKNEFLKFLNSKNINIDPYISKNIDLLYTVI